jgi:hypothetical protein
VKANAAPIEVTANSSAEASIKLLIAPGYHVNANPATYPYLIATEITAGKLAGLSTEKPKYPAAKTRKFEFAEEPLAVYEGETEVKLPLKVGARLARCRCHFPCAFRPATTRNVFRRQLSTPDCKSQ